MPILLFIVFLVLGQAFAEGDDTASPARNLIYPLAVEARAGGKANFWKPKSIPGTEMATQGYTTA
jgi:hypothetical protein